MGNYLWVIILIIKFINKIYKVEIYEIDYITKTNVIIRNIFQFIYLYIKYFFFKNNT